MANPFARYTRWLHTQWPAGKVEKQPQINDDGTTSIPGVRVVGDLTQVPLLKFSADTGAKAIQGFVDESGFVKGRSDCDVDVAIIGAGVSGLSAAIEARKNGLTYQLYESQEAFSTIKNFPRKKPIYTYPTEMEPAGDLHFRSDIKEALLDELEEQRRQYGIEITDAEVDRIERPHGTLEIHFKKKFETAPVKAQRVVIAIGRTGNYRKLNVAGENLDKVSNRLIDAKEFAGKKVLVVGGGDSALEAAIALAQNDAEVSLSYRRPEFQRPKPENAEKIKELSESGKLTLYMNSNVQQIDEEEVTLCQDKDDFSIANEFVFTLIGREPPLDFFRKSKIPVTGDWNWKASLGLIGFFGLVTFLYHWKGYVQFLGLPNTNLWQIFAQNNWFPFNLPALSGEKGLLKVSLDQAANDPGFTFAFAYSAVIAIFGWRRIRRRKTPYVTWQTITLTLIQVIPLFILPFVLFPWMGANGAFTNGGFGEWFGMTFLSSGPGTEPDDYWRAFGFILAWPLFIYNIFTEQPLWGWLILGFIQTFVLIPLIIWRWGKGAYCGWICSCGAMAETLGDQHRHKMPHGPFWNRMNMVGQAILAIAFILLLLRILGWAMPEPAGGAQQNWAMSLAAGLTDKNPLLSYKYLVDLWIAGAIGYGLYFHFSGRVWCRFACPLAALMHIYARFSRFRIFPEKHKCISCNVCTTVCHQGIDVMNFANKGKPMEDPECVRCSACVQSCPTGVLQFGRYNKSGEIQLDRLPASRVIMSEEGRSADPVSRFINRERSKQRETG